jgi:hypothetical protein
MHDNIASCPTRIAELVPLDPVAEGHHDASGSSAGGVWFPSANLVSHLGYHALKPLLWRHGWPDYIKQCLVTEDNPNGTITNSDWSLLEVCCTWRLSPEPLTSLNGPSCPRE